MDKNKGYPLPAGDAFTEEMACTLVFYPDKPEYRRALGGSLAYLTTWLAWEKESEHKGIDAALAWQIAYDLTLECWQMACLESLQDDVAEILSIMQMGQSCCDEQDVTDGNQYTDRVTDGVGDVPQNIIDAGYADDAADWAGFDDYKCMIVHVSVNQMEARLREIAPIVNSYGAVFGGIAALAAILAVVFSTAGLAIVFGLVAGVGSVAILYESLMEGDLLLLLADKITTNHDALACAMYISDGDEGALAALNDKIDELFTAPEAIILKNMNNGPTIKALYSGRYDQQDIAEQLSNAGYELDDFDCSCAIPGGIFGIEIEFGAIWGNGSNRFIRLMNYEDPEWCYWGLNLEITSDTSDSIHAIGVPASESGKQPGAIFYSKAAGDWNDGAINIRIEFGVQSNPLSLLYEIDQIRIFLSEDGGASGSWHSANLIGLGGSGSSMVTVDTEASPNTIVITHPSLSPAAYNYNFSATG
ncbi:MAG: hypothetical protein KAI94_15635 [Anaerolineales bacterium]|nr:hypothetical protein [Anaerolineales bacterium]